MSKNLAQSLTNTASAKSGIRDKWEKCLEMLKEEISPQGFRTWILPIIPVSYVDDKIILRVPSQFFFEWLETNYEETIQKAVKKIYGLRAKIEYLVASTPDRQPEEFNINSEEQKLPQNNPVEAEGDESHQLDYRYQFDAFLVKNDNELALRAAQTVAKRPGKTDFNPLLIYGAPGCGKTHLLNAVGNYILTHQKRKKVQYMSSESFLNEYIFALQNKRLVEFNKKLRKIDVLLLDDVQFLSNKKKSQEALFYFFSNLERSRKQIVVTSNQPPAQLIAFEERLSSFFQKGLIVDLIPAGYETRLDWIDGYCRENEITILADVREFLAQSFYDGFHQLRAIMVRIAAHGSLLGKPVSLENARRMLSQFDAKWAKRNGGFRQFRTLKIEEIIKVVSEYMNVPYDILVGFSRQRDVTIARQIAIFLCKDLTGEPFQVIGYYFNDRHYTAILHNFKKINKELKSNPMLNNTISEIKWKFQKQ